jgi:hypothetical protein
VPLADDRDRELRLLLRDVKAARIRLAETIRRTRDQRVRSAEGTASILKRAAIAVAQSASATGVDAARRAARESETGRPD